MQHFLIGAAAFLISGLTLFSGFGLGTLLLPMFAIFFPMEAAVGLTAVVHCLNNLFKLALLGRRADKDVVIRFGLPAILAAFAGARSLAWLSSLPPLAVYQALGRDLRVLPVKLAVAVLMAAFALTEVFPALSRLSFDRRCLPIGGILSGFFGGLSGHQGALRSAFLIRCGLSKESLIGTGVVIACLVDLARLGVYAAAFPAGLPGASAEVLAAAVAGALLGAWTGSRWLKKVTLKAVQWSVAGLLMATAAGLATGLL